MVKHKPLPEWMKDYYGYTDEEWIEIQKRRKRESTEDWKDYYYGKKIPDYYRDSAG